jgi:acyl-CoA synthetase (AMP-forming)/AMP-acid ligase II
MSAETVIDLFERAAQLNPSNTAIICEDGESITYGSLDCIAEEIKTCLLSVLDGGGAMDTGCLTPLVALMSERNVAVLASMLAVLKANAAYVPVDPGFPVDRQSYILTHSKCTTLICDVVCWEKIQSLGVAVPPTCIVVTPAGKVVQTVRTVNGESSVAGWTGALALAGPTPGDAEQPKRGSPMDGQLAYVLYTSGESKEFEIMLIYYYRLPN